MDCRKIGAVSPKHPLALSSRLARKVFVSIVVVVIVSAVCPLTYAQATGSFSGTVTDRSGANISGATVTATSQATGLTRTAKTDDAGRYLIPLLPVGTYTVRVDYTGFQTTESKDLNLDVNQARELDFNLAPASVSTTVTVTGRRRSLVSWRPGSASCRRSNGSS